ncbi:MAG: YbaB/EbfC family nucleoid-associated protein [Desulfohalobiaceae bacterium]|nr:YbaB/EbfC family nucleoid-associated protein [Desulfohalobiaceae bacterium]
MQELFKQAQQMQKKMAEIQEQMAKETVQASAGGGMVQVTVTGSMEVVDVQIDSSVIDPQDPAMLQDLILAASNEALKKARELKQNEMSKLTGGMNIPGMDLM